MGNLTDAMDKRMDSLLKKAWESIIGNLKPELAVTVVARNLEHWLSKIQEHIEADTDKDTILASFPTILKGVAYIADASAESVRMSASLSGTSIQGPGTNQKDPYGPRLAVKPGKIQSNTIAAHSLFRVHPGLHPSKGLPSIREGSKVRKVGICPPGQPSGFNQIPDVDTRTVNFHSTGSPVGRDSLSGPAGLCTLSLGPQLRTPRRPASGRGWGAHLGVLPAQGVWEVAELKHSSNWKELRAIGLALIFFQERLRGHHVQVRSDNASAVAYVNKQGGTRCVALSAITTRIFRWAETNTLSLSAVFLRGIENSTADFLSRSQLREDEWSLNQEVFHLLVKRWGSPEMDLFVSRENAKTHWFFSRGRGEGARGIDALSQSWRFGICYAFPPPALLPLVLRKFQLENTSLILVAPHWPKRAWFSVLKQLTTEPPLFLPLREDLLSQGPVLCTQVEPCGVVTEESLLRSRGFSDKLTATLLNSRKKETRSIYRKVWLCFNTWCQEFSFPAQNHKSVLEFLQCGADKGLSVSTLKGQVSALSVFLESPLASNPWVIRFFRALSRQKPSQGPPFPKWDLSLVLQVLTGLPFEPLDKCSLKDLTFKTVFLVAVTTARRVSELEALSIRPFCVIFPDRVVFKTDPAFLPKVASKFHRSQEVVLPSFCSNPSGEREFKFSTLDVRCILQYLELTRGFRKSDSLFVLFSGTRKGQKASRRTIARWLRLVIGQAYSLTGREVPTGIKAHSTRAVATSQAERAGATPDQICKAATWSSYATFVKHYRVDLVSAGEQAFGRKVLQAVVPP
ncbi:uncharacterized protein LOC120935688 [Rana temporaria]|uniref:uncharacterized protein LOC120935688 n=1 Tax=Rana temporaria TaxID=8407 RepID=UPI001AAD1561|nr:uncharacterized protein LOC120935688 [Rana temporaria]